MSIKWVPLPNQPPHRLVEICDWNGRLVRRLTNVSTGNRSYVYHPSGLPLLAATKRAILRAEGPPPPRKRNRKANNRNDWDCNFQPEDEAGI